MLKIQFRLSQSPEVVPLIVNDREKSGVFSYWESHLINLVLVKGVVHPAHL